MPLIMDRIASFSVDHEKLEPGIYTSRIDGDIVTYDLRFVKPNTEPLLSNASIHTIEHLFATFARNSRWRDGVIYFGPMGCRTGFYFIVRDSVSPAEVVGLTKQALSFIVEYEGEIPGASAVECGNYKEHDLPAARHDAAEMLKKITDYRVDRLQYQA